MEENVHWPSEATTAFEEQHGFTIFSMRDFGSNAKNMDGPNSDNDAMFLFDQHPMEYKTLHNHIDSIDTEKYGVDFQGWNIKKFADLLLDSNPTAIEFLNSEVTYHPETHIVDELLEGLRQHANESFNPIRLYMHYRNMAGGNYEKYILKDKDRSVNRNLKVIRAALCARHVRTTMEYPPMDFEEFLRYEVENSLDKRISDMLEAKRDGLGDMEAGNPFKDVIENEVNSDYNVEKLNRRGIDEDFINNTIESISSLHYDGVNT